MERQGCRGVIPITFNNPHIRPLVAIMIFTLPHTLQPHHVQVSVNDGPAPEASETPVASSEE